MVPDRQREIETLAEVVRKNYSESGQINWDRLADDSDVFYYVHPRIFVPISIKTDTYQVVAVSPLRRATYGMDITAHEFGHVLLGHLSLESPLNEATKEEEATHFAYALVGKVEKDCSSILLQRIWAEVRYPVASILSNSSDRTRWQKYVISCIRNEAIKELRRRDRIEPART
jgi:hypothetical protein